MSNTVFEAITGAVDEADGTPSTITLPMTGADGKTRNYVISEGTGADMLRLWAVQSIYRRTRAGLVPVEGDTEIVNAMSQRDLMEMSLGHDVVEQMLTDGVPMATVRRAIETGSAFRLGDVEAAKAAWSGKALSPKTRSARTGGAGGATRKASTNGTSTRKKSKGK